MARLFAQRSLLAGVFASLALIAFVFSLKIRLPVAVLLAAIIFVGLLMLMSKRPRSSMVIAEGVTLGDIQQTLVDGYDKLARIRAIAAGLPREPMRERVRGICRIAEDVLACIREDPKHLREARFFLSYLLDALLLILEKQAVLTNRRVASADHSLGRIESEALPEIERSLRQLNENLHRDDVLDLDVALSVLRQTARLEGLTERS